ncbi:hypothetical protein ACFL5O_08960 [Myxococcota bacterium]
MRELEYPISLAGRLGCLDEQEHNALAPLAAETSKVVGGLIRALRRKG